MLRGEVLCIRGATQSQLDGSVRAAYIQVSVTAMARDLLLQVL